MVCECLEILRTSKVLSCVACKEMGYVTEILHDMDVS